MARLSHQQIIELLESLGYDFNKLGMCRGISPMGMVAILAEELEIFDGRINYLAEQLEKLSIGDLASKINSVQEKRAATVEIYKKDLLTQLGKNPLMKSKEFYTLIKSKKFKKHPLVIDYRNKCDNTDSVLNEEELALNEVHAFLHGVVISFYGPNLFPQLFKKKHQVAYNDLDITLRLILSDKLVKKPKKSFKNHLKKLMKMTLKEKPLVKKAGRIIGMYDSAELEQLFAELRMLSIRCYHPIAFHLGSANHQIAVAYNAKTSRWYLIDSNKLPSIELYSDSALAEEIFASFRVSQQLVLDTEVYCLKKSYKPLKKLLSEFEKKPSWKKLHAVEGKQIVEDDLGHSLLRLAARAGDVKVLNSLFECKNPPVEINQGASGKTPLTTAAMFGKIEAVKLLLNHGANPNIMHTGQLSPLALAVENGDIKMVTLFLKIKNPKVNLELKGEIGCTPLHMAARKGELAIAKLLLAAGAKIDSCDVCHDTPLHIAINEGHLNVVEALLEAKANLNVMAIDENTPLLRAIQKRNLPIIKAILNSKHHWVSPTAITMKGMSPFLKAAEVGDVEILKELLICKGMSDWNIEGSELLAVAAKNGHADAVLFLLNHDLIVFAKKKRTAAASSALYHAVLNKHLNVVQALLGLDDGTIDPNAVADDNDHSPFLRAVADGNISMVAALLECKNPQVDVNKADKSGFTPLYSAAYFGYHDVVKLLLDSADHPVDPYLSVNGYSPLGLAAYNKNLTIFTTLLEHPRFMLNSAAAYDDVKDAIHTATSYGCLDIINAALNSKLFSSDIEKAIIYADSMRALATENGHTEVANALHSFVQQNKKQIKKRRSVNADKENTSPSDQQNKKANISSGKKNVVKTSNASSPLRSNTMFLNMNMSEKFSVAEVSSVTKVRNPQDSENVQPAKRQCARVK